MKKDTWKQPTPSMQLLTLLWSMEGQLSNGFDGIIPKQTAICRGLEHIDDMRKILKILEDNNNQWE